MKSSLFKHLTSKDALYWFLYYIVNTSFLKRRLSDKAYLSLQYRCFIGKSINWDNPTSFTEKLQWLKLYNRRPEHSTMVDKYEVKEYVAQTIGSEHIIPTYGVWDRFEDIDFDSLPNQFVLKCTHDSGGLVICKDKQTLDKDAARRKIEKSLHRDYYLAGREWPYKNVPKRIIAEKFITPSQKTLTADLHDYKFFCFNGKVKFFKVDFGRFVEHHANYYSSEGKLLNFGEKGLDPDPNYPIELPINLGEMISLAEKLSENEPFLRVDFYNVNGKIFFGELTFYPASGMGQFNPTEYDDWIGNLLSLPMF